LIDPLNNDRAEAGLDLSGVEDILLLLGGLVTRNDLVGSKPGTSSSSTESMKMKVISK